MEKQPEISFQKIDEVLNRVGFKRSTLLNKIRAGLWPPSIKLGYKAIGFVKHEIDEVLIALINGFSEEEIKALVKKLVIDRKDLLSLED